MANALFDNTNDTSFDASKRRSIKLTAGLIALPMLPTSIANAMVGQSLGDAAFAEPKNQLVHDAASALKIELILGDKPVMRVTNIANKLVILKRMHRGIVFDGYKTYDLNHALLSCWYAIDANRTRDIPVMQLSSTVSPALFSNQANGQASSQEVLNPIKVAHLSSSGRSQHMLRSCLAVVA